MTPVDRNWNTNSLVSETVSIESSVPKALEGGKGYYPKLGLMYVAAWYERAAGSGYAPAQTNLGYMYENGIHLPQDAPTAAALYLRAAEQGFAAAQTNLGIMLSFGLGVPRDYLRYRLAKTKESD